jgi:SAM-dependent methyltransferase
VSVQSILSVGKDGYVPDREFDERTEKALAGRSDHDERLFFRDALEVECFVTGDYQLVAPLLARRRRYRLLDLGCGYGRLAPLLAAFDCAEYLGIDRARGRLDYARQRHGSGICRFELADVLTFRPDAGSEGGRFDVVWTSNVLQHLLLKDKLRLVETALRARAPGGVIILREEEITDGGREDAERRYASPDHARHMVPIPFGELAAAFEPLKLRRLGGIVYVASG